MSEISLKITKKKAKYLSFHFSIIKENLHKWRESKTMLMCGTRTKMLFLLIRPSALNDLNHLTGLKNVLNGSLVLTIKTKKQKIPRGKRHRGKCK